MRRLSTAFNLVGSSVRAVLDDPLEAAVNVRERVADRSEERSKREHGAGFMPWPPCPHREDASWEEELHAVLGAPWPCPDAARFGEFWREALDEFTAKGITLGRGAFGGWGDGEPGFVRAVWCATRHLRPQKVVETGVARGLTSRFVLLALERNGEGQLWSIDLPPVRNRELHAQIGAAVPDSLRSRWTYIRGSSRRRLPPLLAELEQIDLFIHDSKHTERNLLFELERARRALRDGGVLAADDVDLNCGLHRYRTDHPGDTTLVCPAEPLAPDPGRQGDRGVFAMIAKRSVADTAS